MSSVLLNKNIFKKLKLIYKTIKKRLPVFQDYKVCNTYTSHVYAVMTISTINMPKSQYDVTRLRQILQVLIKEQ